MIAVSNKTDWPGSVFKVLKKHKVGQIAYVPDAGHTSLIQKAISDNVVKTVSLKNMFCSGV